MRKIMILTLAVLGMVLGSFAVVQPVNAQSQVTHDCIYIEDDFGCTVADCGDCIAWNCDNEEQCAGGECNGMIVCT